MAMYFYRGYTGFNWILLNTRLEFTELKSTEILETAPRGRGAPKAKASSIVSNLQFQSDPLAPRSNFARSHRRMQLGSV